MTMLQDSPTFEITEETPRLAAGEVHLWLIELSERDPGCCELLSVQEIERANRFHFAVDRSRYISSRIQMRKILAGYAGDDPRDLCFDTGAFGKPSLRNSLLRFNLSHSEDRMLLAVCHGREVGVDLERMRENVPFEFLAEHYFGPEDQWTLRVCPPVERMARFFEIWTRTEAELKASGVGLSGAGGQRDRSFSVRTFEPVPGYAGSVAAEGDTFELTCWQCPK